MEKVAFPNEVLLGEIAQLLSVGREVVMTPKGISMLPFIRGEVDQVKLRQPGKLKVGDIVLAHFGGQYVMHRIIEISGDRITLMGDGNLQGTEQGKYSEVVGLVTEIIKPNNRRHKPGSAWLWRHTLSLRPYLLKLYRKLNKLIGKPI